MALLANKTNDAELEALEMTPIIVEDEFNGGFTQLWDTEHYAEIKSDHGYESQAN